MVEHAVLGNAAELIGAARDEHWGQQRRLHPVVVIRIDANVLLLLRLVRKRTILRRLQLVVILNAQNNTLV